MNGVDFLVLSVLVAFASLSFFAFASVEPNITVHQRYKAPGEIEDEMWLNLTADRKKIARALQLAGKYKFESRTWRSLRSIAVRPSSFYDTYTNDIEKLLMYMLEDVDHDDEELHMLVAVFAKYEFYDLCHICKKRGVDMLKSLYCYEQQFPVTSKNNKYIFNLLTEDQQTEYWLMKI